MNSPALAFPGKIEIGLLILAAALLILSVIPTLRSWRALVRGAGALALISAVFPRHDNPLGQYLFVGAHGLPRMPLEIFGIAWWVLGAWLLKSLLDLILRRTLFPNDNEPHARRLFADLASAFIYLVAFVGIINTVFKQPLSGVLATSGVLAIVLGLALQSTLADVFSGVAINIEHPYSAGDWIAVPDGSAGQVVEINWRATRIRTACNDMIVIPNSVIAKAAVTNHSRLKETYACTLRVSADHTIAPVRVLDVLQAAASRSPRVSSGSTPVAYACRFVDSLIEYELSFDSDTFALSFGTRSDVLRCIAEDCHSANIRIGTPEMQVRVARWQPGSGDAMAAMPRPLSALNSV